MEEWAWYVDSRVEGILRIRGWRERTKATRRGGEAEADELEEEDATDDAGDGSAAGVARDRHKANSN